MAAAAPRKGIILPLGLVCRGRLIAERRKAFASCPAVVELMKGKRKERGKEYFCQLVRIEKEVAKMFGLVK